LKNKWRNNIQNSQKGGETKKRVFEICLNQSITCLNDTLSLNSDRNEQWQKLKNHFVSTFATGILNRILQNHLLSQIGKISFDIPWIIIKFCHMSGIVLSPTIIDCLKNNESENGHFNFKFNRSDLIDFLPVVKCPIFDYFTGVHLLRMGIKESITISKINLFKTATVKLEKVLNLDFPDVCYYYATAVFETTKMDKKFNVDWNLILKVYFQKWQKSGFESGNKECWDFLCTLIWPMFQKKKPLSH